MSDEIKIKLKPEQSIKVKTNNTYLWDPSFLGAVGQALEDADKLVQQTAGLAEEIDDLQEQVDDQAAIINNPDFKAVSDNLTTVLTVGTNISSVNTVSGSIADVNTVAGDISDVSTVAGSISNVNTVSGSISNVNTVATNISDINTVVSNITDIQNASANALSAKNWAIKMDGAVEGSDYSAKYNAGLAATSASNASTSETNAGLSATAAANSASEAATAAMNAKTDMPFLYPFWADHILAEQNFLRADNFSWHDGADAYKEVYNHLVDDIDGKSLTSETISGVTIQYYLADDGHKVCPATEESNVLSLYNTVGIAWYYIIDTDNTRFKLPRTKYGFTGLRDDVGNYVPETLPNITSSFAIRAGADSPDDNWEHTSYSRGVNTAAISTSGTNKSVILSTSADKSSSTYQDNAPVQQRATQMYLYFNVGKPTQTATEQTAGLNAELFNGKVDLDSSWSFPSSNYEDLTLGASGTTYTAPADGWFYILKKTNGTNQYLNMTTTEIILATTQSVSGVGVTHLLPVSKNQVVKISYNAGGSTDYFRFIYAQKSN